MNSDTRATHIRWWTAIFVRRILRSVEFKDAIKNLRKRAGLNQTELGEAAGMNQPMVSKFERGAQTPTIPQLDALEDALGVERGTINAMTGRVPRGDSETNFYASQLARIPERRRRAIEQLIDAELDSE